MGFGSFPAWLGRVVGEGDIAVVLWWLVAWVLWLLLVLVWAVVVARLVLELSVSVSVGCSGLLSAPASPEARQLGATRFR